MADRRSALAAMRHPAPAGASRASLREFRPGSLVQVGAWPDTLDSVQGALRDLLGMETAGAGRAAEQDGTFVATLAPGRFLLLSDQGGLAARLEAALPSSEAAVVDLDHARTCLRLEGEAAVRTLAKGIALDLHPSAFPVGRAAFATAHHMDFVLFRRGESSFDIICFRTFAVSLADWLLDAGLEFGIAMQAG